ncbi:MAG: hypothetical protein KKC28_08225 [Verrucomicrobia bacterium]|nr:hypothetical protein [Verrucomicrobiota bacterium]
MDKQGVDVRVDAPELLQLLQADEVCHMGVPVSAAAAVTPPVADPVTTGIWGDAHQAEPGLD